MNVMRGFVMGWLLVIYVPILLAQSHQSVHFDHLTVREGLSQNTILGIAKDKYGFMWFGTYEGVCRYDGIEFRIFRAGDNKGRSGILNNRISNLYVDTQQTLWVLTGNNQIAFFDYGLETFQLVQPNQVHSDVLLGLDRSNNPQQVTAFNGTQWAISNAGLVQKKVSGASVTYQKGDGADGRLSDFSLSDIYLDNQDVLWVGTEFGGINKADLRAKPFVNYTHRLNRPNTLASTVVRAVAEDRLGNVWVGYSRHGLSVIQPNGQIKHLTSASHALVGDEIRALYCDKMGDVWIGTKTGLSRFQSQTNRFENYRRQSQNSIPGNSVFCVAEDRDSNLWIGTFNGLARFIRNENRFVTYDTDSLLGSNKVRAIFEDGKNQLWIATEGGGVSVLRRDEQFYRNGRLHRVHHFTAGNKPALGLPSDIVLTLAEDAQGRMWLGTNNGLCCYDVKTMEFSWLTMDQGFPDALIMGLLKDERQNLWVSHKRGLTRLSTNGDRLQWRTYTHRDGLPASEFSQNAFAISHNKGQLMFGSIGGLTVFHPDSLTDNPHLPQLAITGLRINDQWVNIGDTVNGRVVLPQSLLMLPNIELLNAHRHFAFRFAALHFANPMANQYKYMLEGYDKQWIYTNASNPIAAYANLPHGRYVFKVMASNCDGVWNPVPKQLEVIVLPPWWRTWWAYLIYGVAFVLMITLFVKFLMWREALKRRLALEKLERDKDAELMGAKIDFFTHLSHELRTPLSLILDPLEQISTSDIANKTQNQLVSVALQNARKMHALINQLLDFRKLDAHKMTIENEYGNALLLVKRVCESFDLQITQRGIAFEKEFDCNNCDGWFDAAKFEMVVSNILSNAVKYTPNNGRIDVRMGIVFINSDRYLKFQVADTGIGIGDDEKIRIFSPFYQVKGVRPFVGQSSGVGLSFTRQLVELMGGKIDVGNNLPNGSVFTVCLPFNNHHSENDVDFVSDFGEKPLLLLVDDQPDLQQYLSHALGRHFRVVMAQNGQEGLDCAIAEIPDAIVSDVMMPIMDGFDMCAAIKADERTCHIPVVLLTARVDDESRISGFKTGADLYHAKPFQVPLLMAQINALLENRRRLKHAFVGESSVDNSPAQMAQSVDPFLTKAVGFIEDNMHRVDFTQEQLADFLAVSKRQLYRKIDALTGQTLHQFIISIRMERAKVLLQQGHFTVSEVAYQVGFSEPSNFSRTFSKHFGMSPTAAGKNTT
jgi:signal transduction histidine kinase/ligand-binding sensor domain-containing protein/DNA-binding response OmpR family regulator